MFRNGQTKSAVSFYLQIDITKPLYLKTLLKERNVQAAAKNSDYKVDILTGKGPVNIMSVSYFQTSS